MDADLAYEQTLKALADGGGAMSDGAARRSWCTPTADEVVAGPDRPAAGPAGRDPAGLPGAPGRADRRPDRHPGVRRARRRTDPPPPSTGRGSELWWGDERFVPADDSDRNDKQALDLLEAPLRLNAGRIHRMPVRDRGMDLDQAAEAYAVELGGTVLDICLLGLGPEGHVASLFPEHPSSYADGDVIAVRSSPKPPPERISLTLPVINRSREVWFLVSGADKAAAAKMALLGAGPVQVPGGRSVRGRPHAVADGHRRSRPAAARPGRSAAGSRWLRLSRA